MSCLLRKIKIPVTQKITEIPFNVVHTRSVRINLVWYRYIYLLLVPDPPHSLPFHTRFEGLVLSIHYSQAPTCAVRKSKGGGGSLECFHM